jgi:hypothetical protein
MINPKQKAEELFLTTEKSQKEIAEQLGIDPKTLYRWIKQGHWRELKSATRRMPSVLVENIYEQLDDINYSISQRERGSRHPGKDESLTINRLINCIEKVKKQTSQGQNIEFMMNFIDWVLPQNKDLADLLTNYGSAFLKGSQVHGFHPYDIEYPNPALENETESAETDSTQSKDRHPELVSGPYNNTDLLAPNNAPSWPTDPNCKNPKPRHPEFISGPYNNTGLLVPDKAPSWPIDPNSPTQVGPARQSAALKRYEVGHESGIPHQLEINFQPTENQLEITESPELPMPEMPENNFPENRASEEIPLLRGDVPQTTNVVSEQGCVQFGNELQPNTPFPPASEIDFTNPNALYDLVMKQEKESEEEYQLFSIGEAVYRMRIDKKSKKRSG